MFCAPAGSRMFTNFAGSDGAPISSTTRVPFASPITVYAPAGVSVTSCAEKVKSMLYCAAPAAAAHTKPRTIATCFFIGCSR